jgi:hypothetical protein
MRAINEKENTIMLKLIQARNAQREAAKGQLRMNLQYFAEDTPADNPDGEPGDDNPKGDDLKDDDNPDESKEEKSFTKEELDNIIKREKAKALKQAEALADQKLQAKLDEAEKLKKMNDDEKSEYEKQKLEDEVAELRKEKALNQMSKEATSMLADKNIQATDDILAFIVNEDAEVTSENVKKFTDIMEKQRAFIREEFNKKLGGRVPIGGTSDAAPLSEAAKLAQQKNQQRKSNPNVPNPWENN